MAKKNVMGIRNGLMITVCLLLLLFGFKLDLIRLPGAIARSPVFSSAKSVPQPQKVAKSDVYGYLLPDEFYYWRNTLSADERTVYDQFYANALALNQSFDLAAPVTANRILDVLEAVRYDNPELFWLDYTVQYYYNTSNIVMSVELSFEPDVSDIPQYQALFDARADSLLTYVSKFGKDIDKVKYIHDLLTNINDFKIAPMDQNAYSALALGKTVCMGYASAFQYFMQRLGIPCALIVGVADGTELHAWNLVKLDGEYYNIDPTWDDPVGNSPVTYYYDYFNITDAEINRNHKRSAPCDRFPAATGTTYSYTNYYRDAQGSDFTKISFGIPVNPPLRKLHEIAGAIEKPGGEQNQSAYIPGNHDAVRGILNDNSKEESWITNNHFQWEQSGYSENDSRFDEWEESFYNEKGMSIH